MKFGLLLMFSVFFFSCEKTESPGTFTGTVLGESIGCNGAGPIEAWEIQIDHMDGLDSSLVNNPGWDSTITTVTLPVEFHIVNKRIRFNLRNWQPGDPGMTCNTSVVAFEQVVFDVVEMN